MEGLIEVRFVYENGAETVFKGKSLEQWCQQYLQGQLAYKAMLLVQSQQEEAQAQEGSQEGTPEPQGVKTLSAAMAASSDMQAANGKRKKDK